jgi:hypothetical protein
MWLIIFASAARASAPSSPGDLTLTEFQADTSAVPQYYGEWFEVRNNTATTLDLQGLVISCTSGSFTVSGSLPVPAGEYAVFAVSSDPASNGGVAGVDHVYPFASCNLAMAADVIRLQIGSLVIDEVVWTSEWPTSRDESHQLSTNALTLEWANDLAVNWCPSTTYIPGSGMRGTPGAANRYCSDDPGIDADGDGYTETEGDCDDTDATVNPGVIDDAVGARADDNCDGVRDDADRDADGDGLTTAEGDCDDSDAGVSPRATERVNGVDDNCDGCIDEVDADGDGWLTCDGASGVADCDDARADVHPEGSEIPYDGVDQDCSEGDACDVDGDGELSVLCAGGGDCDDADPDIGARAVDVPANGVDEDCDGVDAPVSDGGGDPSDTVDVAADADAWSGGCTCATGARHPGMSPLGLVLGLWVFGRRGRRGSRPA